ncbi:monosaccharide-sensing protein 2-like [Oryza brachyantha]|uniref:Major facilitator superfamily (MFS) profile domain-containing protein n=1 Tax=Oryza brachyantha TaxID=4533 RepID=J3N9M6_ORYBR|nr:monosaccharide-sensing protein 2-like [Oryza brachyantha]XP_040384656.1 monosaccharide-sensing protein 2-like [Oryza brachyantha]
MKSTVFSAVAVSIGYTLLGWDFTAVLEANLHMKKEFDLNNGPSTDGIILAVSVFGAIVITVFSGSLLDWLGRRAALIYSSLLLISGGLLMVWSPNIYILLLARLIVGSGSGLVFTCVPIYISETSPPSMRGSLGTMPQLMFFVGMVFSYSLIFWMTLISSPNWRIMIGAIFAPSMVYFTLLVFYLPESPRWLVSDGKISEARISLQWLRGKDDVSGEIALIADGMNMIMDTTVGGHAIGAVRSQSFLGTSTSQMSRHSTFYWHLSDPLVDLLGSIHESMSEQGAARNSYFPVFNSFNIVEEERLNEQTGDDSLQQTREAYSAEEGNNGENLQTSLLSQVTSAEVNDINTSFTSEGSSSYLRRHGTSTSGLAQDLISSLHDHDIEEDDEEIHGAALSSQPALGDMVNRGLHPFRQHMVRLSETADIKPKWRVLLQPGVRHALCYGMLIQALQQSAGISGLLQYNPQILEQVGVVSLFSDLGLDSHSTSILISALNALLMLPCITASMMLMDVCGRRALLLVSIPILILSVGTISFSNIVKMGSLAHGMLFQLSLTICFCSYVVGLGPIPNILCSEMFSTRARATCASFCSLAFWFGRLLSIYCFPVMLSTIGLTGACGIYAFVCCMVLLFVCLRVPETKGLPLELIAEIFKFSRQECL